MDPGLRDGSDSSSRADDSTYQDINSAQRADPQAQLGQQGMQLESKQQQDDTRHTRLGFLSALPKKRDVMRQFTPSWFTVTMGTGTVALSIAAFPFHFQGQDAIATAVWALNVALFILFSCLMLGRVVFFTSTIVHLFRHPNQSLFVGAIPMAFGTITNGVVAFLVPRHGVEASAAAHALFWTNLPAVLLCIVAIPFSMFTIHDYRLPSMTAVWLMPVVPACVAANTAGVVARTLPEAQLGMTLVFIGTVLMGVGFLLSYQITTIYYNRLICHKLPAREVIVSSFLPVGPMAMTALAVVNLALAAEQHLQHYMHVFQPDAPVDDAWVHQIGHTLVMVAGMVGLALWGFAVWWMVLAVSCIIDTFRQGIPFNLGWWGSVFPVGNVAINTCQLAALLKTPGFDHLAAVLVCAHVLLWIVVVSLTAQRAWLGQLFHAPCLHATALAAQAAQAAVDDPMAAEATTPMNGKERPPSAEAFMQLEEQLESKRPGLLVNGDEGSAAGTSQPKDSSVCHRA